MEVLQIVGIGIVATVIILLLKDNKPEFAILVSIATSIAIFYIIMDKLLIVVDVITDIAKRANSTMYAIPIIFKIVEIGRAHV